MKIIATLLFSLLITASAIACDCDQNAPFLSAARNSKLVALVKVKKYLSYAEIYAKQEPMSMEVEIVEVFKGAEARKKITVWGDNGMLCRPYLSKFSKGDYYIIAFNEGTEGYGHVNEKRSDYHISNCGTYWLSADKKKQQASGNIGDAVTQMTFADIKKWLSK